MVAADRHGVRIVLGVYGRADDAPSTAEEREDYCRYVRNILLRYSEIRDVVIWNEANSDAFWRPDGRAPAAAYAALLVSLLGSPALVGAGGERDHDDGREP